MKSFCFRFVVAALAFAVFLSSSGSIAAAPPAKKPEPPADLRKLIKSVDAANSLVVIQYMNDKTTHAYKIDDVTMLKVNNVVGKISDIKPGMLVDDYVERDDQTLDGLSVSGESAPAAAPKPKAPAKPAKSKPTPPAQT